MAGERRDDYFFDALDFFHNAGNSGKRIDPFAVVEIAVGAKQHFGFDLAKSIHYAVAAEVRRTR